ncbi:MAG: glycosyl hydrolase [Caulobacter sp.]|nr:glycosyl hydrolase [Caulobacter sp.]
MPNFKLAPWALSALALAAVAARAEEAPSPVRLNQLGFETQGPKRAIASDPSKTPLPWRLIDASGVTRASGQSQVFGLDAASGDHPHQVDLSDWRTPGQGYRLRVGAHESRPFAIGDHPYGALKRDALAFFYQNRSGVAIEARYVSDPALARPAGHAPDRATCFDKTDEAGNLWAGCGYALDASKGWYDAGDHGKYVVNGGIAAWTLLNAYERAAARGTAQAFADGTAQIPERANGVSDLLDEARWELEFLLAMAVPAGTVMALPVGPQKPADGKLVLTRLDASGMAHQRLHDKRWTPLPTAPQDDHETRYLYYPTTAATLNLAAVAAQCARIWKAIDPAFAARCLTTARTAYAAALRNPQVYAIGQFTGGGGYGDGDLTDEAYWAAAELFVTTGEAAYGQALIGSRHAPVAGRAAEDFDWGSVATLGVISLAVAPGAQSEADRALARAALVKAADAYVEQGARQGYRLPYAAKTYPWGSNASVLNHALVLGLAYDFTGRPAYRAAVVDAMDYILGRNPLDQSYVTGYGARPVRHPHHRFWTQQADPRYPAPPPGVLSGGPNDSNMSDPVAATMKGHCAPQTCWRDDYRAFTQNEVAINWNAPLVWVAAWLDETP